MIKINVLGTEYEIKENCNVEDYKALEDKDGYTDSSIKQIVIADFKKDYNSIEDLDFHTRKVKRHEIIHAMLYESGLDCNTDWATNEEIVDWIAMQYPKLKAIFEKLDIEK